MVTKRKEIKKEIEDEDMKKWCIQLNALSDMDLTDWEQGFIANVSDWCIGKGGRLSEKQSETLERVYRKYF